MQPQTNDTEHVERIAAGIRMIVQPEDAQGSERAPVVTTSGMLGMTAVLALLAAGAVVGGVLWNAANRQPASVVTRVPQAHLRVAPPLAVVAPEKSLARPSVEQAAVAPVAPARRAAPGAFFAIVPERRAAQAKVRVDSVKPSQPLKVVVETKASNAPTGAIAEPLYGEALRLARIEDARKTQALNEAELKRVSGQ